MVVILLNGPSGAGKSTTAKALLERVSGTWAYIAQDDVRDLVKHGYRSANGMPDTWDDEVMNQMAVSIPLCCDMVKRYNEYGINCVVDFFAEADSLNVWLEQLSTVTYSLFVLLPNEQETLTRNRARSGTARLADEKVSYNHRAFAEAAWPTGVTVIETSHLTVPEVVDAVLSLSQK